MILCTGHKSNKLESVAGFNIGRYIMDILLNVKPVNERILKLRSNINSPVCVFCFFRTYFNIVSPSK